jgi:hypothetical protein
VDDSMFNNADLSKAIAALRAPPSSTLWLCHKRKEEGAPIATTE